MWQRYALWLPAPCPLPASGERWRECALPTREGRAVYPPLPVAKRTGRGQGEGQRNPQAFHSRSPYLEQSSAKLSPPPDPRGYSSRHPARGAAREAFRQCGMTGVCSTAYAGWRAGYALCPGWGETPTSDAARLFKVDKASFENAGGAIARSPVQKLGRGFRSPRAPQSAPTWRRARRRTAELCLKAGSRELGIGSRTRCASNSIPNSPSPTPSRAGLAATRIDTVDLWPQGR